MLPLGSVSANMAAPFDFGSAMGNLITNPQDILEVEEENITFELSGRSVSAYIIYEIVHTGEDADFTFIFPALMEGRISKIGVFLYRHFPFLYGEAFGYFLFYFILPIGIGIAVFILIYFLLIRKRRLQNK